MIYELGRLCGVAQGYDYWHLPIKTESNIFKAREREHSFSARVKDSELWTSVPPRFRGRVTVRTVPV